MESFNLLSKYQDRNQCDILLKLVDSLSVYCGEAGSGLIRWQRYFEFPENWKRSTVQAILDRFVGDGISVAETRKEGKFLKEVAEWLLDCGLLNIEFRQDKSQVEVRPRGIPNLPPGESCDGEAVKISKFLVLSGLDGKREISLPHSWCDLTGKGVPQLVAQLDQTDFQRVPLETKYLLLWLGVIETEKNERNLRTEMWSTHELWFHERSRRFGRSRHFGGSFWGSGKHPVPDGTELRAVLKEKTSGLREPVALPEIRGLSFRNHSVRKFSENPIQVENLTEFLARAVGLKSENLVNGYRYKEKEYPSGGAAYEHEIFMIIRNVESLENGLYWLDDGENRLNRVHNVDPVRVQSLWNQYEFSVGGGKPAAAVIAIADFARIFWKYEQMAYSLVLKNTGSLLSTMYVAAKDCGLACCAIGSGDSDLLLEAIGLDPLKFGVVGELVIGIEP